MRASDLTRGEKLLLVRRRAGKTQVHEARANGVSLHEYRAWEKDSGVYDIPQVGIGKVASHEVCFLARHRAGMTVASVAEEVGVCRWWCSQMERGTVCADRLLAYWNVG